MSDREHAEEILETARRDLRAVRAMHDTESFPDEIFGFHAQQSVEKALKAWVALLGKQFPKTHDIKRLIDVLRENGIVTETLEPIVPVRAALQRSDRNDRNVHAGVLNVSSTEITTSSRSCQLLLQR